MKFRTETHHYFELPNGAEVELPCEPEDWLQDELVTVERPDGGYRVAYLTHDEYCSNPLEDCDGMGAIWHHPRSHYGKSDGYYESCGLDSYGDPIIDEDKLQQMWHDAVMALSLQDFYVDPALRKIADAEDLRQMLADESVIGDYTFEQNARSAWGVRLEDADPDDVQALIDKVEEKLSDWSYALAADECQQPMDEYAVLLDVYDHSGRSYSLSGGGVQCRWDTSRGEALWIADKYAKEEIDRQAKVYAFGKIQQFKSDKYYPSLDGAPICAEGTTVSYPGFEHWHEAFEWLKQRVANLGEPTDDQLLSGHNRALYEIASECVKTYNSWQCGDCYGVICVDYDAEGKQVGEADACWGYTGIDWARQERDSFVKGMNRV
jgi:hypothetical protein